MSKVKENLIYVLALFPIFNFTLVNISILLFVVGSGIKCLGEGSTFKWPNKRLVFGMLVLSLPFLLNVISLLWTQNIRSGSSFVERTIPFLIVPLVILFGRPFSSKESIHKFLRIYIFSNVILAVVVLVNTLMRIAVYYPNGKSNREFFGKYFRGEIETIPLVGEHPIYLSLLIGSALLFLFYVRFRQYWVYAFIGCLFLIVLFLTSSRGPIAALLIALCVVIILKRMKTRTKIAVFGTFFLFTIIGSLNSPIKSRMMELMNTKHIYPIGDYYNSFNIRMGIYRCCYEIGQKSPWYGLSPGDVQDSLNVCYKSNYVTNAYNEGIFNTHSQYLFYWLSFGTVGLILILGTYFFFYRQAFLVKDKVYIVFLVYILLCFLFENILSRNTGIMVFVIFNSLFYYKSYLSIEYDRKV